MKKKVSGTKNQLLGTGHVHDRVVDSAIERAGLSESLRLFIC
jgi:hypothetical protein